MYISFQDLFVLQFMSCLYCNNVMCIIIYSSSNSFNSSRSSNISSTNSCNSNNSSSSSNSNIKSNIPYAWLLIKLAYHWCNCYVKETFDG